jgi:hypothetical protein
VKKKRRGSVWADLLEGLFEAAELWELVVRALAVAGRVAFETLVTLLSGL